MISYMSDDEWSDHVAQGEAFATTALANVSAGLIPHVQLFNPVASGIRVRLYAHESMTVFGSPVNKNLRRFDTPLTSLNVFTGIENLLGSGGASPLAEPRVSNDVALLGSPFGLILSAGNTRKDYPVKHLEWGHDLLPGQGYTLNGTVGGFLLDGFMWVEVPL